METKSSNSDSPLLCIAPELRNAIYDLVFSTDDGDVVTKKRASLTQTCRQIRSESHAMLYSTHYVLLSAAHQEWEWRARLNNLTRSVHQLQNSNLSRMKGFKVVIAEYLRPLTLTRVTGSSISTLRLSIDNPGRFMRLQIQAAVIEPLLRFCEDRCFKIVMDDKTLNFCADSCLCSERQDHQVFNERLKLFKIMENSAAASQDTALVGRIESMFIKLQRD